MKTKPIWLLAWLLLCGGCAGALPKAPPTKRVSQRDEADSLGKRQIAEAIARLMTTRTLADWQKLPPVRRCKRVYQLIYSRAVRPPKQVTIAQQSYLEALLSLGPKKTGYWMRFVGRAGGVKRPLRRFFLNLEPDHEPQFSRLLLQKYNDAGLRFSYKLPRDPQALATRHAVLYVPKAVYAEAKRALYAVADALPTALASGDPPFTKPPAQGDLRRPWHQRPAAAANSKAA